MLPTRLQILVAILMLLSSPSMVMAETVYETQREFLDRAFSESPPEPSIVWLSGDRKSGVEQILGHYYPTLRLRYWCRNERSAWILEEIGKDLPITVGVVVNHDYIESLRVLTYRENRGGEVTTPSFTEQFNGSSLDGDASLDRNIDGITGATLSARALTRLAKVALFMNQSVGCNNGS